ncbi:MAG TPA: hypothetical protein VHO69_18145, partial [Phototrophicaceae bacterium]|nr:hypothetical protein [Phototrophicaceae bacterium]
RVLVLWVLVGLAAATTLAISLVLYVDAVNTTLLTSRLQNPPYAFLFRYLGSWNGNITQADVTSASAGIETRFTEVIDLPVARAVSFVRSVPWTLNQATAAAGGKSKTALGTYNLGVLTGADEQLRVVAGEWPVTAPSADETIPVLLSETMLYTMGLEVGDLITATRPGGDPIKLRVVALWQPLNANDPAWIFPPGSE